MSILRLLHLVRAGLVAWSLLATLAPGFAWGQLLPRNSSASTAPPAGPLTDCGLYRYWDQFDRKVADTVQSIGQHIAGSTALSQAAASGGRVDVTAILYQENLLQSTPECSRSVVHAYLENDGVLLVIESLHVTLCEMLVNSRETRAFEITVLQTQTGRSTCGRNINPIPGMMTLGPLTMANRMVPGWNTVSIYARGPFAAPSRSVKAPVMPQACPELPSNPDRDIEAMIARNEHVTTDFPRSYPTPICQPLSRTSSSTVGVCTTAQWEDYHDRLYTEFESMLGRAQNSNDPVRIMSAAWWVIDKSNPSMSTIRDFDYKRRECDAIRNRFVAGCAISAFDGVVSIGKLLVTESDAAFWMAGEDIAYDELKKKLAEEVASQAVQRLKKNGPAAAKAAAKVASDTVGILAGCVLSYGDADKFIDWMSQPLPFPEYRLDFLQRVKAAVQRSMVAVGYSNCPYYADAVMRLDLQRWQFEYNGGMNHQMPIDWKHDFKSSALKCMLGQ